jgi:hypothetical protein
VAVLAELWWFERRAGEKRKKNQKSAAGVADGVRVG